MLSATETDGALRVITRPLTLADVPAAVKVHLAAFPSFFLSFLGPRFLRLLYSEFATDPACVALVAEADGRVAGAVAGPLQPAGYFSRLVKRRWFAFALASSGAVLRKPLIIPRLFRALFYRGEAPTGKSRALLSTIAVDPAVQGAGIGRKLVAAWLAEVQSRGASGAYLTTDAEGNDAVNRFYQQLGWQLEHTWLTPEGRRMNRYVQDFR
jgi:ribosomal protein S18 acetylase RimI-like enzyme